MPPAVSRTLRYLLLLAWLPGLAAAEPAVLELPSAPDTVSVDPFLQSLPEGPAVLTLDEVRRPPHADRFQPLPTRTINRGFDQRAYWYRVRLSNRGGVSEHGTWVLEFSYPLLNFIDVHLVRAGQPAETLLSGTHRPASPRQLRSRTLAFPLDLRRGEVLDVYFRIQTQSTHVVNLNVTQASAFTEEAHTENLAFGMFFGLMAGLALYNVFVLLTVRDVVYGYHVLYILTIIAFQFHLHGFSRLYPWHSPGWTDLAIPLFIALPSIFSILFSQTFLQTRRHAPTLHRCLTVVLYLLGGCTVLALLAPYSTSMQVLTRTAALVSFLLVITGIWLFLKGVREARFYLLAWSIYLVAVVLRVLVGVGVLPPNLLTDYGIAIGSSVVVTLLSLALADRIVAANGELERRVEEKRRDLEQSYRQMQELQRTQAVAQERERIMRDLHDGIGGQLVTALNLARKQGSPQPIEQTLRDAMDDMRLVVDSLHPVEGDLLVVLATTRDRFGPRLAQQGLRFNWQVRDIPPVPDFGPEKALQILRILQEALANILKHAKARAVTVRSGTCAGPAPGANAVFIEIEDDGIGIPDGHRPGRGLDNMRWRAARVGGELAVASSGSGTVVRLSLPAAAAA